jgi:hypothetical protein
MPDTLTRRQLNRATLSRQMLLARERVPVVLAVERLAGMQAQEPMPPFVGLWSRVEGFTREDLHRALHDRTVVRATMMRGTPHLMSAGDYAALRACLQPVMDDARRILGARAEGPELDRLLPVARELLEERPRGFNELRALLMEAFPHVNDRALGFMVRNHLSLRGGPDPRPLGVPSSGRVRPGRDVAGRAAIRRRHVGRARAQLPCGLRPGDRGGLPDLVGACGVSDRSRSSFGRS